MKWNENYSACQAIVGGELMENLTKIQMEKKFERGKRRKIKF